MFSGMAHVCIGVKDLDKMIKFYTETLGFAPTSRRELPSGSTIVMVNPGGDSVVELTYNKAFLSRDTGNFTGLRHIAFWVGDIMKVVADFKAKGISFYREPDAKNPHGVAFFRDPEGTDIELIEKR